MRVFLRAFRDPYTYNPFRNLHTAFGILWGLPVPVFAVGIHLWALQLPWTRSHVALLIRDHPVHLFFLLHPVFFALVFGAFGTIRRAQTRRIRLAEQEKIRREMELAREVQDQLLPQSAPHMETLRYEGVSRPAFAIGGDFYDFLRLPGGSLCLALGDVSGKGISAALLMASLHAMLRASLRLGDERLADVVTDVNRILCEITDSAKHASLFCGIYHEPTRRLTYVNAGHPPAILLSGGDRPPVRRLKPTGMVLGLFPEATFHQAAVDLAPGDLLCIYSDGITEATNGFMEEFGEGRLVELLRQNLEGGPAELTERVLTEVAGFLEGRPSHDDLTLVLARGL